MVLCTNFIQWPDALWAESAPSFAPVLAPLIVRWLTQRDDETSLPELSGKSLHSSCSAIVGIKCQHHTFDLWCISCQPERSGGSAGQDDYGIDGKPRCQQNQAIEAAFDQDHPFGKACWCVKAEQIGR